MRDKVDVVVVVLVLYFVSRIIFYTKVVRLFDYIQTRSSEYTNVVDLIQISTVVPIGRYTILEYLRTNSISIATVVPIDNE